jgi:hypothetical protein
MKAFQSTPAKPARPASKRVNNIKDPELRQEEEFDSEESVEDI